MAGGKPGGSDRGDPEFIAGVVAAPWPWFWMRTLDRLLSRFSKSPAGPVTDLGRRRQVHCRFVGRGHDSHDLVTNTLTDQRTAHRLLYIGKGDEHPA